MRKAFPESLCSAQSFLDDLTAESIRRGTYLSTILVQGSNPVSSNEGELTSHPTKNSWSQHHDLIECYGRGVVASVNGLSRVSRKLVHMQYVKSDGTSCLIRWPGF